MIPFIACNLPASNANNLRWSLFLFDNYDEIWKVQGPKNDGINSAFISMPKL